MFLIINCVSTGPENNSIHNTHRTSNSKDGLSHEGNVFAIPQIGRLEQINIRYTICRACFLESEKDKINKKKNHCICKPEKLLLVSCKMMRQLINKSHKNDYRQLK